MYSSADARLATVAANQHGVFEIFDARECGLSEKQIKLRSERVWVRLYEGVYCAPGVPTTWEGALRAATLAAGPGPAAVSHRSAAALYELPWGRRGFVELTCLRWDRSRHEALIVHESRRLPLVDITNVAGIPTTTPERTLIDLAWLRPSPKYLEAVIHAARRRRLITYDSTLAVFSRHARRGLRGVAALRAVLEQWDPTQRPTESDMETRLVQTLRTHGLPEPILQYPIHDERGIFVARVEAAWPQWRACVDYDSKQEHSDEFQLAHDAARRNRITAAGWSHFLVRHDALRRGAPELIEHLMRIARRPA